MKYSVSAGIVAAVITILLIIYFIPPTDDFNSDNPGWNGLSDLSSELHLQPIKKVSEESLLLNPSNTTLLIIGPEKNFTVDEAFVIRRFAESGGIVVLADDFGSGNTLLRLLGVNPRFDGSLLVDPLFKDRSMKFPKILRLSDGLKSAGVDELIFNYATVIDGCGDPIAFSSFYSFLDTNLNGVWDVDEPKGPFAVACVLSLGRGRLILVADPSITINSMLKMGSNLRFLKVLMGNRTIIIDESHWVLGHLALAKGLLNSLISFLYMPEVRYTCLAVVVIVIIRYRRGGKVVEGEVEKVLMRNPTWDREVLAKLEREMRGE